MTRTALIATALIAATAIGEAEADEKPALVEQAAKAAAAFRYYRDLAEWQLRRELDPADYGEVQRSIGVVLAIATGRPADAIASAVASDRPVLRARPVPGGTTSDYGLRKNPFNKRRGRERHSGVDLSAARGTPVHAAGPGEVVRARRLGGYGRVVYLDHGNGTQTRYAHLQKILVEEGQFIAAGTVLGRVGSSGRATGPHLHFEVRQDGRTVAPADILRGLLPGGADWLTPVEDPPEPRRARKKRKKRSRDRDRELRSRRPTS
jgi:murein DD-endopeptidase MepM/ murein hydrolase activator NlpD